jgi:hypothetical protein
MILFRLIFQAKLGKGGELAAKMVRGMHGRPGSMGRWRVLTDLASGPFDTVVMESETESLAVMEQQRAAMFADPAMGEMMAATGDLIASGRAELYTIEGRGGG